MRYVLRCSVAAALLLLLGVSAAPAQHAQTRQGFWIGFGLGMGSLGFSCELCEGRESAVSGYLKMGGTLGPKLLLGGETNGWTKNVDGDTYTAGNASFAAYFYPMPAGGWFLRGGLGLSSLQISGQEAETGFGLILGTGYDIRVGNNFSITPVLNFNWGKPVTGLSQNVLQFAIGATFH